MDFPMDFPEFPWVPGSSSPIPAIHGIHGIQECGRCDRGALTGALGLAGAGSDRERCFWAGFDGVNLGSCGQNNAISTVLFYGVIMP